MKIFKNSFLVKLIASICLFLVLIGSMNTNIIYAANDDDDDDEIWGGELLIPIVQLVTAIGDAAVDAVQKAALHNDKTQVTSLIKVEGEKTASDWVKFIVLVVIAVIAAAAVVAVGGWAVAAVGAKVFGAAAGASFVIKTVELGVLASTITGVMVGTKAAQKYFPKDIYLPMYKVTAEEIFSNKLALFDVNFFKPNNYTGTEKQIEKVEKEAVFTLSNEKYKELWLTTEDLTPIIDVNDDIILKLIDDIKEYHTHNPTECPYEIGNYWQFETDSRALNNDPRNNVVYSAIWLWNEGDNIEDECYTILTRSDSETVYVFYGHHARNNVYANFGIEFGTSTWTTAEEYEAVWKKIIEENKVAEVEQITEHPVTLESTAQQLRGVISQWYFVLRNLALLILMLVLIYVGIRIVIGSTAGEKAKYKERLIDWLVALCLVMIMHYIMVFAVELVEKITDLVGTTVNQSAVAIKLEDETWDESLKSYENDQYHLTNFIEEGQNPETGETERVLLWPTDLMGAMRIKAQQEKEGTAKFVGYSICFLTLVFYTVFFAWTYLKRITYMAFLTMMAPLVAMTYPIDKIVDGKAQAFNTWLREYIFNLMIQPLHLLLYTVLVTSAYELAEKNALYAVVAIGFMIPAEKLVRKMFGFEKAKTPGLLGGAAGAALAMTGIQKLVGHGPKGRGGQGNGGDSSQSDKSDIKFSSSEGVNPINNTIEDMDFGIVGGANARGANINVQNNQQTTAGQAGSGLFVNASNPSQPESAVSFNSSGPSINVNSGKSNPSGLFVNTSNPSQPNGAAGSSPSGYSRPQNAGNPTRSADTKNEEKNTHKRRLLRTMGAAMGSYGRGLGNKAYTRIKNGNPVRSLARGTLGLASAATFGTIGLALGVASGDPTKAFQYTTALTAGGYSFGRGVAGSVVDTLSVNEKGIKDDVELEWYGEDYKKEKLRQRKEEFEKSEENITYLRKTLGVSRGEAKDILEEYSEECINSNVSKIEDVAAIRELVVKQGVEVRDAIAMKKFSDRLPKDIENMSATKLEQHRKQFEKEITGKLQEQVREPLTDKIKTQNRQELLKQAKKGAGAKILHKFEEELLNKQIEKEDLQGEQADQAIDNIRMQAIELTIEKLAELQADEQIQEMAKEKSEEIMKGISDFSTAKASLRKA